jgi:nucleotide-binding universal stress UspA family protein
MNTPLRLLVATDGSPAGEDAVQWSAGFAAATGAQVVLAHVVSSVIEWVLSAVQIDFMRVEQEHQALLEGAWSEPFRAAGVPVRTRMLRGDAAKLLGELAEEEDSDLIVVGRSGRGATGVQRLGSVALRLVHHTTRPLVLVPRPEDDESDHGVA